METQFSVNRGASKEQASIISSHIVSGVQTVICLAIILLLGNGCAIGDGRATNPKMNQSGTTPKGESVVFGRLVLPVQPSGRTTVVVTRTDKWQNISPQLVTTKEGLFCWHFEPGKYAIAAISVHRTIGHINARVYREARRVYSEFIVPSGGQLIYVGDFILDRNWMPSVADEFDATLVDLKAAYPNLTGNPIKMLLRIEQPK